MSDSEREHVVARLNTAVDEGRLSLSEFDERARAVYAAKFHGDLAPVVADLPAQRVSRSQPTHWRIPTWVKIMWIPWVFVNVMMVGIWLATGVGYFWPFWVAVPWGCGLLIPSTIGVLAASRRS